MCDIRLAPHKNDPQSVHPLQFTSGVDAYRAWEAIIVSIAPPPPVMPLDLTQIGSLKTHAHVGVQKPNLPSVSAHMPLKGRSSGSRGKSHVAMLTSSMRDGRLQTSTASIDIARPPLGRTGKPWDNIDKHQAGHGSPPFVFLEGIRNGKGGELSGRPVAPPVAPQCGEHPPRRPPCAGAEHDHLFDDAEMASPQRYACVSVRETPGARAARHMGYGSIAATLLLACQC